MPRRNLHRKRKILFDSSKYKDPGTTNLELLETSPTCMATPVSTSTATREQISPTPLQPTRHRRIREYSEAPGLPHPSPSRYHGSLGAMTGHDVDVAMCPDTPSTSSIRTTRSYLDSSFAPISGGISGYSPRTTQQQQQQHDPVHNLDYSNQWQSETQTAFVSGSGMTPLPIPGDRLQGTRSSLRDIDPLAQNRLQPLRPPDQCALIAVEYNKALMAQNDMTFPHCAIYSGVVHKHRFHASLCPPCPGFTYTTAAGYIPNPRSCLILRLKIEEIEVETSFAVIDGDGPSPGADVYLGQDFWNKLYSRYAGPIQGASGMHMYSIGALSWAPGNFEAWPPTGYTQGPQVNRFGSMGGFPAQTPMPHYDYGTGVNSLMALNGTELDRSEAAVGYPVMEDSMLSLQSPYGSSYGPLAVPGSGNYTTSVPPSVAEQYSYALSPGNKSSHSFETSSPSG